MSTKTLRKRIALSTVVALGAGVLSLVSVTSAHATGLDTATASVGLVGPIAASPSGQAVTYAATLLSTGSLTVTNEAANKITVSAGAAITGGTATIATDAGSATAAGTVIVTPNGAAGSTFTLTETVVSSGALVHTLVVTIAGSSVYNVPSASKSYVSWIATGTNAAATTDATGASSATSGNPLYLQIDLRDAYGNAVTKAGALTIVATSGANVAVTAADSASGVNAPTTNGTYGTAVFANVPATSNKSYGTTARISEATAGAGWSGSVTVSYNGIVIGTKSGTITGLVSKLTATPNLVVGLTNTDVGAITYKAYDAAGNAVALTATDVKINANTNTAAITGLGSVVVGTNAKSSTATASGSLPLQGGQTAGKASISLKYTRTDGVAVVSNTFDVLAGGAAYSYTAKLDKSSYNQGDIATLTVSFLDSKGNAAGSDSSLYAVATTGSAPFAWDATVVTPMLASVGSIGSFATSDATVDSVYPTTTTLNDVYAGYVPDAAGTVTFKFTVGSTGNFSSGNYNAVVTFPTLSHGASQTVAYTVGSQGTSLNDVLKGIVALIASINKQIAALAKLVTKKK